ncbi:MAG TPA: metallophosphoesterase [Tepidisphaeraceae bacterium]|nr:metallophosphoesterase [Tepidisphaeraceae bacterium]
MVLLIICLLFIFDAFLLVWADRRLRPLKRATLWRTVSATLIVAQIVGLALMLMPTDVKAALGASFWRPVSTWLYVWHLLVVPVTVVAMVLSYLGIGVAWLVNRRPPVEAAPIAATPAASVGAALTSRRRFLGAAAALAPQVGLGAALVESERQAGAFRVRDLTVNIPGLPRALDGMVIAHLSDSHAGRFVRERQLEEIVEATVGLKPDLVAFTGDLIDHNLIDLDMSIAALRQLERVAKVPIALCVGNHDLFENGQAFRRRLVAAELGLLVNEGMPVTVRGQKFDVLGLDWGTPDQPRAAALEEHMRRLTERRWHGGQFGLLLAHHPHAFDPAADAGIPLTLAGHTHGGQLMLTPKIGLGPLAYKYYSGLYERDRSRLVVSNGVGNWFPIRVGAPAEIVKITVRGA